MPVIFHQGAFRSGSVFLKPFGMSDSNAYNLHLHKIVLVMPQSTIILVIRKGLTIIYHKLVMGQIKMLYQVKMVYQLKMVYQVNIVY